MLSLIRKTYLMSWTEDRDKEVLRELVRVICSAMKNFCWDPCVFYEGVRCLLEITKEENIKGLGPMEITMLIDQLIESGTKSKVLTYDIEKLNAAYSYSWNLFYQPQILNSPLLKIKKLCSYTVDFLGSKFAPTIPAKQLNILWNLTARFDIEDAKKLCERTDLLDSLLDFLHLCNTESKVFMEEHRESINIALELIYSMTREHEEIAQYFVNKKVKKIHAIPLLIQLSDFKWTGWPEKIKVLEILVNLTRVETCMKRWGRYLRLNSKFLRNQLKGYYKYLNTTTGTYLATDKAHCSMTILSCLMCLPNQNKKKYYKWKIENTKMIKACQKIQSAHISIDHEFYLSCPILMETLKKSKYDGPVMWALLTMKAMLERDIHLVEIFKDNGLLTAAQRVRSEETGVMKLRGQVLRLLY